MSSNGSSALPAKPLAPASLRCFDGRSFTAQRLLTTAAYLALAAFTTFGCTRTAAMTQGTEASLLVAGFEASRAGGVDATAGLFEGAGVVSRGPAESHLAANAPRGTRQPSGPHGAAEAAR
jgi:hypothetical protein